MSDVVMCLEEFYGKLIAGVGSSLILFDYNNKQLVKVLEINKLSSQITKIKVFLDRIFVTTINDSVNVFSK